MSAPEKQWQRSVSADAHHGSTEGARTDAPAKVMMSLARSSIKSSATKKMVAPIFRAMEMARRAVEDYNSHQ